MYEKPLKAFHAVAVEGGFTAASRALSIGQPTVSTHVHLLEETFGVELFHRRGRTIELTPVGRTLFTITLADLADQAAVLCPLESTTRQDLIILFQSTKVESGAVASRVGFGWCIDCVCSRSARPITGSVFYVLNCVFLSCEQRIRYA